MIPARISDNGAGEIPLRYFLLPESCRTERVADLSGERAADLSGERVA